MQRLIMIPATGERMLRFVGDRVTFKLRNEGEPIPATWRGFLRTNMGRADVLRHEIIHAHTGKLKLTEAAWRDIPMVFHEGEWGLELPLAEVGYFHAKTYAVDERGRQHWPEGPNASLSVHPDSYRTANTIYCAFVRMFGESRVGLQNENPRLEHILAALDKDGFTVIPPSGKLRDLIKQLPHIIETLGCRILHLLPVTPTPTVYAKFGRFGSPYAVQDLLGVDPALVEFDKRTTGVDQFRELTYAAHARGARVFLDVVINHTGWGSTLQEHHPEWFVRDEKGFFVSPGAWGVVWEDLTELHHKNPALWEHLGDVFLEWCRRGVDGFRCDAGYKIPVPAWRYITARVLEEFPETIFLLEGLGGSWEATENLLGDGGMQWAYSELFQNYSGREIANYLDYSLRQSERTGLYVHYSETHDNDRLAKQGRVWSLLRNRLCALTSVSGGFGFTCGVEWLASEKLLVHQSRGLAWDNPQNIVAELSQLNRLLTDHPCFFDGAILTRLSPIDSPVYALSRVSQEGQDRVLIFVNTDVKGAHSFVMDEATYGQLGRPAIDLFGQPTPEIKMIGNGQIEVELGPGACVCLAATPHPVGLHGDIYRERRAQAAWALTSIRRRFRVRDIGTYDWRWLAELVCADHREFLGAVNHLDVGLARHDLGAALRQAVQAKRYPQVVTWTLANRPRVTPVPDGHWLLIEDDTPFRGVLNPKGASVPQHVASIRVRDTHIACFPPGQRVGDAELVLERYAPEDQTALARFLFLSAEPGQGEAGPVDLSNEPALALLTNGIGGMARMPMDLSVVQSKYDCVLAANLHATVPVDRHVFVKRLRVWVSADGFVAPLSADNLVEFLPGPPAQWRFVASAGDSRAVELVLTADMLEHRNTTVLRWQRPAKNLPFGKDLPENASVSLIVRCDIEDRNFHTETHRNSGAEHHFSSHTRPFSGRSGFEFVPAADRHLRVFSDEGIYHHEAEWCQGIPHPREATRGQVGEGDAYSPGWFEVSLVQGRSVHLVLCADDTEPAPDEVRQFDERRRTALARAVAQAGLAPDDAFGRRLTQAVQAFVVRRGGGKTVIAGYPWFLDWGRDSLICARGLLAAGLQDTVKELLVTFGRFAEQGTLPNSIHGEDASNRDTSDAPLWYGVVCGELAALAGDSIYSTPIDQRGRTLADALREIARGYRDGTPNGIRMDARSGLIWSPSHFTWMDTNHPAGTPREGYPVEIQVLWICLLRQLARVDADGASWAQLAARAEESLLQFFWLEERGYFADLLIAKLRQPAADARPDDALRSNYLFAISLGLVKGERARSSVRAACQHLVVPGALRSLAPLPVSLPLPILASDGRLLNNPLEPYWSRYEGDEDTYRKPAYHNGTAWTWTFPTLCEALVKAWESDPAAIAAAKSLLSSTYFLLFEGCPGQLPEILDGDSPHRQRGCDAQAWSVTEALRVWRLLQAAISAK